MSVHVGVYDSASEGAEVHCLHLHPSPHFAMHQAERLIENCLDRGNCVHEDRDARLRKHLQIDGGNLLSSEEVNEKGLGQLQLRDLSEAIACKCQARLQHPMAGVSQTAACSLCSTPQVLSPGQTKATIDFFGIFNLCNLCSPTQLEIPCTAKEPMHRFCARPADCVGSSP